MAASPVKEALPDILKKHYLYYNNPKNSKYQLFVEYVEKFMHYSVFL